MLAVVFDRVGGYHYTAEICVGTPSEGFDAPVPVFVRAEDCHALHYHVAVIFPCAPTEDFGVPVLVSVRAEDCYVLRRCVVEIFACAPAEGFGGGFCCRIDGRIQAGEPLC